MVFVRSSSQLFLRAGPPRTNEIATSTIIMGFGYLDQVNERWIGLERTQR